MNLDTNTKAVRLKAANSKIFRHPGAKGSPTSSIVRFSSFAIVLSKGRGLKNININFIIFIFYLKSYK